MGAASSAVVNQFVKIYGDRLLKSSLWNERPEARLVFLGMLALADWDGIVDVPNVKTLTRVLNLPAGFLKRGLAVLEAPDEGSRTPDEDGRRLVFEGNRWRLVNYTKYRETRTRKQELGRLRVEKHREKQRVSNARNGAGNAETPDQDRDLDQDTQTSRVDPDDQPGTANDWLRYFGTIWAERRDKLHYGHSGDAKACGSMQGLLDAWPAHQRADAWGQRERIVKGYMAETEDRVVKAGHIFAFFVPRFTALFAKPAKKSTFNEPPDLGPEPAPWPEKEQTGG